MNIEKPHRETVFHDGHEINVIRVVVDCGSLSTDNGAQGPIGVFFELAKLTSIHPEIGDTYGQDCLLAPEDQWPTIEALLKEHKMIYRLSGHDQPWQNILNEKVRHALTASHA